MKETGITMSIIIPVYNVMAYLRPCLDGLLSQTCPAGFSYEVLLADDGSTDGSGAVCDEYAAAYRQVRALHRENGGQSAARNQAIRAAEGAWLAFVDSDDLVRPEFLAALAGGRMGGMWCCTTAIRPGTKPFGHLSGLPSSPTGWRAICAGALWSSPL